MAKTNVMRKCHHHYEWYHGKFVCRYCGHKHYPTHRIKRIAIRGSIIAIIFIVGFLIYQNSYEITSKIPVQLVQNQIEQAANNTIHNIQSPKINIISTKPVIKISELEQKIHVLINVERQKNGLQPVSFDNTLERAAIMHSQDMATRNYFEHDSPEGQTFSDRFTQVGFHCEIPITDITYSEGSENIYQGNLYNSIQYVDGIPVYYDWNDMDKLANQTVEGWMNSSGHRQNILTSYHQAEGIGIAIASDDKVYVTEDFC
ncbi:MAG: CAP domain-containing protein [Nitrosopumilaceae archaeon]